MDTQEACLKEPGDIVQVQRAGINVPIIGEIGELVANKITGRSSNDDVTVFKSVVGGPLVDCASPDASGEHAFN